MRAKGIRKNGLTEEELEELRSRRQFLKASAFALGTATLPVVITLTPAEARASGSWTQPPGQDCRGWQRRLGLCQPD